MEDWAELLSKADLSQGQIVLRLDRKALAKKLDMAFERIDSGACKIAAPFQTRRRGVETKIILGGETPHIDHALIQNIVAARLWYGAIKSGMPVRAMAAQEGVGRDRIQKMIGLAFLAPEILDAISEGAQPLVLTSDRFKRRQIPMCWAVQSAVLKDA